MTIEGIDGVLDIHEPTMLHATGDWQSMTVYRSRLVLDTDPMFVPVTRWIEVHEMKLDDFAVQDDPDMLFGEGIAESWSRRG